MTPYQCIIADPAWRYSDTLSEMKAEGQRGVESRYKTTMTLDEICQLAQRPVCSCGQPRREHRAITEQCPSVHGGWWPNSQFKLTTPTEHLYIMGQPIADNAHLWLWITNPMLCAGYHVAVLRAWDFTAKTMATWVKGRLKGGDLEDVLPPDWSDGAEAEAGDTSLVQHFAQGRYLRGTTEHCILAVRGHAPALVHDLPSAFVYPGRWPGRLHSEKPPIIHEWAERLSPGPRVELFARRARAGWDAVGDELGVL